MPITHEQYQEMIRRLDKNPVRAPEDRPPDAVGKEIEDLHDPIMAFCRGQVPAIPYVHSNPYRKTTVGAGCPDFILAYRGQTLWIECKDKDGKLKPDQLAFKMLLEMQEVKFHLIRSMREFHDIIAEVDRETKTPHV